MESGERSSEERPWALPQQPPSPLQSAFSVLTWSLYFYFSHALVILGLALFAAAGRAVQIGWSARISSSTHLLLEVLVEGARLLICLAIVGDGSPAAGIRRIRRLFAKLKVNQGAASDALWGKLKARWMDLVLIVVVFSAFAYLVNFTIGSIAQSEAVLERLRGVALLNELSDESLGYVFVFVLKNLTIIPFTLVWWYGLYRWLRYGSPSAPSNHG
jgi:hypothetical protein